MAEYDTLRQAQARTGAATRAEIDAGLRAYMSKVYGIMATGMVFIIVTRNIDLSVGSLLGFLGYTMALVQTDGTISVLGRDASITLRPISGLIACSSSVSAGVCCVSSTTLTFTSGRSAAATRSTSKLPM